MARRRLIAMLVGALLVSVALPAGALAGTLSWTMPGDFTASGSGANPDHDPYGGRPWSYEEGPSGGFIGHSHDASLFTPLPQFATTLRGGLSGWTDPTDSGAVVAANARGSTITNGTDSFAPGQLVLGAPSDRVVAVGWTSPLAHEATVSISGAVTPDGGVACYSWSLEQNGQALASSTTSLTNTISTTATVPPGGSLYLILDPSTISYNASCATAGATLNISANETAGPHVTLARPGRGAIVGGRPTFSGQASTGYGTSNIVAVRIYGGSSTAGTLLQTLTTTRAADGSYSIDAGKPLPDGTYTAQAEQDDLSSPPDAGLSSANTFVVHTEAPAIKLASLGRRALRTASPKLTGTALTGAGYGSFVTVEIYRGTTTTTSPVRYLGTRLRSGGRFSLRIEPPLQDGRYTAVAEQSGPAGALLSEPVTFAIKVHAPTLSILSPAPGTNLTNSHPRFSGAAGNLPGDASSVTVQLFAGSGRRMRSIGTVHVRQRGGRWLLRWPRALPRGRYTLRVTQTDSAGHVARVLRGFLIVPAPTVIGPTVTLTPRDTIRVAVTCLAPAGRVCRGDILILTVQRLRPLPGGPSGQLRLMFAYVTIAGGHTESVTRSVPGYVAAAVRRARPVQVRVSAQLTSIPRTVAIRTIGR